MRIGRQRRVNGWKRDRALGMLTLDLDVPLMAGGAIHGRRCCGILCSSSRALDELCAIASESNLH